MMALPPRAAPARPRMFVVATALASAGVIAFVGGMLAVYAHLRDAAGGSTAAWLPEGVIVPEIATNMMLVTMIAASITVQWAQWSIARNDRRHTYVALALAAMFGFAVLNAQIFVYQQLALPIADPAALEATRYALLVYAITGTFVALLITGIVFTAIMAFRALGGRYSANDTDGIAAATIYWHVLTAVFCAVWYVIYVLK